MPSLNLRKKITGLTSHPKKPPISSRGTDMLLELLHCFSLHAVSQAAQLHRSAPGHDSAFSSHHIHPTHHKAEDRCLGAGQESLRAFSMHEQHSLHRGGLGSCLPHKSWELLESRIVSSLRGLHMMNVGLHWGRRKRHLWSATVF